MGKGFIYSIIGGGILLASGLLFWNSKHENPPASHKISGQEMVDLQKAEQFLTTSQPEKSLEIIFKYKSLIDQPSTASQPWVDLLIRTSEALYDTPQLLVLDEHYPDQLQNHEKASLLVAETYITSGNAQKYAELRQGWKDREKQSNTWLILDADKLLLDGRYQEAVNLLNSKSFEGKEDTRRLIRLAILQAADRPHTALMLLSEAQQKDPHNSDIHIYRARILENAQSISEALIAFQAAAFSHPENVNLQDQLAEFYLRHHQYAQALKTWTSSLVLPSADHLWSKALFWNRVLTPAKFQWNKIKPANDNYFANYLLNLKPDQFWDSVAFANIPQAEQLLKNTQSTFWLQLLEALKNQNDIEALHLLDSNPFTTVSWNPELELALKRIIAYRATGQLSLVDHTHKIHENSAENSLHPFFTQLDQLTNGQGPIPADMEILLKSKEAYAAAFLAAGWLEAALQLNAVTIIPENFPDWVVYGLAQAIKTNRDPKTALAFISLQHPTSYLALLRAELMAIGENPEEGLQILARLSLNRSELGHKAANTLAHLYIKRKEWRQAKETINAQPTLAHSVVGKEMLARIALEEGNGSLADSIYSSLEEMSYEAKSYLARKAFEEKNWSKARQLTEELLRLHPHNQRLRANLDKIMKEQRA